MRRHSGYIEAREYTITWAVGHLVTLADAHDYDRKYKKWSAEDLPIVPKPFRLKVIESSKEQYNVVASLLKRAKEVIVATDAGREGQLIYELIALSAGYKGKAKRLWLSSLTEGAIREALNGLKNNIDYRNLYFAGFARAQADWLVGINATRAMTTHAGTLLTIGRVQTPTLAMIVHRDCQIEQFKPEPYFELEVIFTHVNGEYKGKWFDGDKQTRFNNKESADRILGKVKGQSACITKLTQKTVPEQPPQLFDLTSLQRTANQKFGFTADQTLKLAQSLYETHKVLTYPRTDSRYVSDDIVPTLRKRLSAAGKMFPELTDLIPHVIRPTKRVVNGAKVSDHHAIIPTETTVSTTLRPDERKIYELVTKQTLAALLVPAEWASTTIKTTMGGELFKTSGRVLVKSGWKSVFGTDTPDSTDKKVDDEDTQATLPMVEEGDKVTARDAVILSKQTKPPSHFTEASLLSAMEHAGRQVDDETLAEALKDRGLGTPATRASIIEKIKRDGYVEVNKKHLVATNKGRALIEAIHIDALKSPELTGDWEHRLAQIESGNDDAGQFISEITEFTRTVVATINQTQVDMILEGQSISREAVGTCPLCGGAVIETKKSYGCVNWKTQGCKFTVWKRISGHKVTQTQVKELLTKKRTKRLKFKSKAGKDFEARLVLTPDASVEFEFERRAGKGE